VTWNNVIRETNFRVLRNGSTLATVAQDVLTYDDLTAVNGVRYSYAVVAFNECGDGATSPADSGGVLASLNAPTNVQATDNLCDSVVVTWMDNNSAPQETGHNILRDGVQIGSVGVNVTTFTDLTPEPGVVYAYTVQATGTGGPATSSPNSGGAAPLPGVPVLTLTDVTCDQILFTWVAGANTDTVLIYRDGVLVVAVAAQNGNSSIEIPTDGFHSYNAVGANECGRGDTSNTLTVQRDQLPPAVTSFDAQSVDCETVELGWDAPAGVDSIRIFRNTVLLTTVPVSPDVYIDVVGNGPQEVQYWYVSVNECGESMPSQAFLVNVEQAPTIPTNVTASNDECTTVTVTWSASQGEVNGYDIYRDGILIATVDASTLEYVDTPGDSDPHQYSISASSINCIDSEASVEATGSTLEQVGVPGNVTQQDDNCDMVTICWTAATGDLTGYVIYIDSDSVGSVLAGTTCFTWNGEPGTYSAQVAAYSALCGVGTLSSAIDVTIFAQPVAPPNFAATDDRCDNVVLTWGAQPEFTGVTAYRITRDGNEIFNGNSLNETRTFTDTGASIGAHTYEITALSSLEDCEDSAPSSDSGSLLPLPGTPTNVNASDTSCLDVYVTWTSGGGTVDGFIIFRNGNPIDTVGAGVFDYHDTGIAPGASADYAVMAFDNVCGNSAPSFSENGTRLLGPDAPTGVLASDDDCDEIAVSWNAAPGDVTEYRVYRDGILAGSVLPPQTNFVDAPAAGTYAYTVTAFSVNCGETAPSVADNGTRLPQMGQVTGVVASVDSCNGILVSWTAFTGAVSYNVSRGGGFIATVNAPTTQYFDNSVAEGVAHSYTIEAVNPCNTGLASAPAVGSRASTPGQVTGLTATNNLISQVCLNWTDVAGELSYQIYRDDILIATNSADDVDYCDLTATPGVTYTYTVAAANVCGEGDESAGAQGVAVFSLGQVTGVTATTTDCDDVCLSWTDISNETGYEILRNGVVLATVGADVVSYCDATVAPGECFTYTVRGFNVGGTGPESDSVQGCRRTVPSQVTGVTATSTNCNAVVLTWNDATDEDRYDVYRDGNLLVQNAGALTYTDNSAVPGVVYSYTIRAVNACGNAPFSTAVQGVRATVPPLVAGLVASVDVCGQITINWTDQLSETGYRVYRDGNFLTPIATLAANTVVYVDNITGSHTYHVRAFNDCGNGELGSGTSGIGLTVPGVATGITASENCGDVTVNWTAPAAGPIQEYRVLRNGVQIAVVPVGTTTYNDNDLAAGNYTYRIITANQCGAGAQSAQSNGVTVLPALVQVPTFTAVASPCFCVDITWGNVINEDGYFIYCDGAIVDTINANITSARYCPADTQSCVIQVAAFNSCGIGPLSQGISVTPNTYPIQVSGFAASENLCDRVRLTWSAYNQPGVTHLKLRRDGTPIAMLLAGNTSFEQLGIWPQSVYSIAALRVCAAGDTIESPLATDNGRTAPTPVAPTQMAASDDGCGFVTVTFNFTNVDGQDSVWIKRNGNVIARLAGGTAGQNRQYVDNAPLAQAATYQVCPVSNICGEGDCASDIGQAAPTAGTVTNVAATNDRCTSIIISWTGTQHALNYQVRRNGNLIATVPQGQFSYTDNVPTGTSNNYTVTATNACGSGPQSPTVPGSTIPLPPVPTGVNASDGLCNQVIVTWNEIAVATGYEVWRNNALLAEVPGGIETYTDLAVTPGTTYNYQVRGVNQCGLGTLSAATTGFSAQQVATVTNVVASTNLNDRVRITWNNVAQETGYEILRGFPPEVIATVGIDVTSYNDFSAAPGEEYEYRVRAFNGCGSGQMSAVSYGYRVPVDPIPFGVITVTEELFGCMSAVPADMDEDGDMDVVAAGMFSDKVVWYENNGTWAYIPHVIVENWDGARAVAVGDIDDDGDLDVAAVAQFADQLVWFRQNASGTFTTFVIANNYDGARDVLIVDLDRDGDKDLVTAACDVNDISWWRNNGSETFTRVVVDNNFVGARTVEVADIGNDNDWDILASAYEGGMLAWYSNGGGMVYTRHVLLENVYGASYINAARLNADNVLDIYFCVAQDALIGWIDGATQEFNYVTSLVPFPREMDAIDMDDDNRADLLLAANENQEISWWRNTDNRFYRNPITTTLIQASVVKGGDFDSDGDTDVLGAGEGTIKIWLSSLAEDIHGAELALPQDNGGTDQPYSQHVVPLNYELSSNYPNPFNPMTQIRFGLPEAQSVKLTVYDVTGREVARLADGAFGAGFHTVTFDASNLASGLYLYRIEAGEFVSSRKMILMK
ncbi:VCBS repeat-containing protein, partial [bacterium]|nr:VCBS repeat-containing protein [bacterium]